VVAEKVHQEHLVPQEKTEQMLFGIILENITVEHHMPLEI
jgi:hypothetical protein